MLIDNAKITEIKLHLTEYLNEIAIKGDKGKYYNPIYYNTTKSMLSVDASGLNARDFEAKETYNIFSLYASLNNLDVKKDFIQIATELAAKYNIDLEAEIITPTTAKEKYNKEQPDNTEYFKSCKPLLQNYKEAIQYLNNKKIADSLIEKYNIGYDASCKQIIIPCGKSYFEDISITENKENNLKKANISACLFNGESLKDSNKDTSIFVCENILDALSIESVKQDAKTISLNGISNTKLLYDAIEQYNYKGYFILCLSADDSGINTSKEIYKRLNEKAKFCYVMNAQKGSYKDANTLNELMIQDAALFNNMIYSNSQAAKDKYKDYYLTDLTPTSEYFDTLERDIKNTNIYKPTRTGISIFDTALNGGFFAKQVITLISGTSLGKTAFALQLADNIAKTKPVLYFSLEMSQAELIARSISRYMNEWQQDDAPYGIQYGQLDLLQGKQFLTPDAIRLYEDAKQRYIADVKDNLIIYECLEDSTIKGITDKIKNYIAKTEQRPIVFIDYLQYIDSGDLRASDMQAASKNIREIKKIAREQAISIFLISSTARGKDKKELDIDAAKSSGDIEYTSDIVLSLNLKEQKDIQETAKGGIKDKDNKELKKARAKTERDVYIRINKNRNGKRDFDIQNIKYKTIINTYDFEDAEITDN